MDDFESLHIDCCPDIDLGIFDLQLGLVNRYRRVVVGLRLKQVRQSMIPLAHSFV
ncbi:hypothetical protein [Halopenitus persicus]|uniref:hypothetical protein n=1 Tax=Halopenitus persicus TaxID=1048396 RepID=UPI0012FDAFF2|nr:hypothetical protein [Halopenitus persicus]